MRLRLDGEVYTFDDLPAIDARRYHSLDIVVDRLVRRGDIASRLTDSVETALSHTEGLLGVQVVDGDDYVFSERFACPDCGISYAEIAPRLFSFNSPQGACPACDGLGANLEFDADLVVADPTAPMLDGAVPAWGRRPPALMQTLLRGVAEQYEFDIDQPFEALSDEQQQVILYGTDGEPVRLAYAMQGRTHTYAQPYDGVIPGLQRRYRETESTGVREELERYMRPRRCTTCQGARLRPEALAVRLDGRSISEVTAMSIEAAHAFFSDLQLSAFEREIAANVLDEIRARLHFLKSVGLGYLTLNRTAGTLSGGEGQRIRLATQIGSGLVGVLYILDEPSIGLHQCDNQRLLDSLLRLRDLGNTVLVVEHDRDTILAADYVLDIGPGAGEHGGHLVAAGAPQDIVKHPASLTGQYLSGAKQIAAPARRRQPDGRCLRLLRARANNLKQLDVTFPLGLLICVTGVSGSGKSTLILDTLAKALARQLHRARSLPGAYDALEGTEHLDKVIHIDQAPIGRTPRSNPATYTGMFDAIRGLFAQVPEARMRGYKPGRFSFNYQRRPLRSLPGAWHAEDRNAFFV